MKYQVIIFLIILSCSSCRAFRFQPLNIDEEIQLPPLNLKVDVIYDDGMPATVPQPIRSKMICQTGLQALSFSDEEFLGKMECRVIMRSERTLSALTFLSTLSLGMFNFLGIPFSAYKNHANITVTLYDLSGRCIGTYFGQGTDKRTVACYYGYSFNDATKKSGEQSLINGLQIICDKIAIEQDRIIDELNKGVQRLQQEKQEKQEKQLDLEIRRKK